MLTTNAGKIAAANLIFNTVDIEVLSFSFDIPEIQASTSQEIANYAALSAFEVIRKPVIREDHSFFIDDLGIPGPYMVYMDKKVTVDQLLKIVGTLPSRKGHFELAAAYVDEDGQLHEFNYQVPIEFSSVAKGDPSKRWERVIRFKDDMRVFAEYPEEDRSAVWAKNFERIAQYIAKNELVPQRNPIVEVTS